MISNESRKQLPEKISDQKKHVGEEKGNFAVAGC